MEIVGIGDNKWGVVILGGFRWFWRGRDNIVFVVVRIVRRGYRILFCLERYWEFFGLFFC